MYLEHGACSSKAFKLSAPKQNEDNLSISILTIIMPRLQDHGTLTLQIVGLSHSNTQFWKSTVLNRKM